MATAKKYHFGQEYYSKSFDLDFPKPWYQPHTTWPMVDLKVYALPDYYSFDLAQVKNNLLELVDHFGTVSDQNADYSGLSLTARNGIEDPLQDWHIKRLANNSIDSAGHRGMYRNQTLPEFVETPYDIETEAMTPVVKAIASKFKSSITKISLVKLEAGGAIVPHVDFPYYRGIRLHASMVTNDRMWYDIEGERFQIPADGKFYFFNAGLHHGVVNEGNHARINLNINLLLDQGVLAEHGLKYMIDHCML